MDDDLKLALQTDARSADTFNMLRHRLKAWAPSNWRELRDLLEKQACELEGAVSDKPPVEWEIRNLETEIEDLQEELAEMERNRVALGDCDAPREAYDLIRTELNHFSRNDWRAPADRIAEDKLSQ